MSSVSIKKFNVGYTQVPNTMLCDPNLSAKAKGIYCYLFSKPDGWVFHTETILKELKEGRDSFYAAIDELISKGYIERTQKTESDGKFGGIIYEFKDPQAETTVSGKSVYGFYRVGKIPTHNNTDLDSKTEINNIPPIAPPKGGADVESSFEEFWSAYVPVKVKGRLIVKGSKKVAEQKYRKAINDGAKPEEILEGLRKYLKHCLVDQVLSCGAAVFLNQERWKDEYAESSDDEIIV